MATRRQRWHGLSKATRDAVIFVIGAGTAVNELLIRQEEPRTKALIAAGVALGAIPIIHVQDWINARGGKGPP